MVSHPSSVDEIKPGDLLEGPVVGVKANHVVIDLGVAQGTIGLAQLDRLVQQDEWFRKQYPERMRTARALNDEGVLEEDIYGTLMRVRVRDVDSRHGRIRIRLEFVAWLA